MCFFAFFYLLCERLYKSYSNRSLCYSSGFNDDMGGLAVTLVDALDTLWIMDMKEEFYSARDYLKDHMDYTR